MKAPGLAVAWRVRPVGRSAFVPPLLPAVEVVAGSTWSCAGPGWEGC